MAANTDLRTMSMTDIVTAAWSMRDKIDLTGIGYGRISWGNGQDVITDPFPYYFFLAGMVRLTGASHIAEVGTHQGGSAKAMAAGLGDRPGKIVTFDVKNEGVNSIGEHPVVKPFQCDANGEQAYRVCLHEFGGNKIDFAYIDTEHRFWPTVISAILYGEMLAADFMVLDDITLNDEMKEFWALIRQRYGDDNTIDASVLYPQIRMSGEPRPGFGVVRLHNR
jgi:hypothetical protein